MIQPLLDREHWESSWEGSADPAHTASLNWMRRYLYNQLHQVFSSQLSFDTSKRFLEVGCGAGKWLVYFAKTFGYSVCGIDYSETGVQLAKKAVALADVPAEIYCRDVFSTNFSYTFDVVLSDGFLEHFSDAARTLEVLWSLTKERGLLITIVPNISGLHLYLLKRTNHASRIFETHRALTKDSLIGFYQRLGFRNIRWYALGSVLPKLCPVPLPISRSLNLALRLLASVGVPLEGERVSSTYLVIGEKP